MIRNNTGYGANVVSGATLNVTSTSFTDNTSYAIGAEPQTSLLGLTGLTLTGNGGGTKNHLYYRGGTITGSETWRPGVTWLLGGSTTVGTAPMSTAQLTIEPGVHVEMGYHIYLSAYGRILAVGTSTDPIQFTSYQATPTPGYWRSIYLVESAPPQSQFSYVSFSFCGYYDGACVVANGASPVLDHVTISNSSTAGLLVTGATASVALSDSVIRNNTGYGVNVASGATLNLTNTSFTDNTSYAIGAEPQTSLLGLTGLTLTGNGGGTKNHLYYRGGTITGSETWRPGVTWLLGGSTTVGTAPMSTAQLAIEPGVHVEMGYHIYLSAYGRILAVGTSTDPIQFTSYQATPTPGYWRSIYLVESAPPQSQFSYVSFSFCGYYDGACVVANGASPVLDHVTISNSSTAGLLVTGATASVALSDSVIRNNTGYGVNVASDATLNLTNTSFTDNTSYAIGAEPQTSLLGLTGLTLTGNGGGTKNHLYYRGGTITGSETWRPGVTWLLGGSTTVGTAPMSTAQLAIEPGVHVEMGYHIYLSAYGRILAVGTSTDPIQFTSYQATPTPGYWRSIYLVESAPPQSQFSYVSFSFCGYYDGACVVADGASPAFDHVTISSSSTMGLRILDSGAPTISNSSFTQNANGLSNWTPSTPVDARLNYWGASDGPSGSGNGSGQSVSTGALFAPWLATPPSAPNYFASAQQTNAVFNPTLGIHTRVDFATSLESDWIVTILNSLGNTVRTWTGSGASGSAIWDGTNAQGVPQASGVYSLRLDATALTGEVATQARGIATLDNNRQLTISNVTMSNGFLSPNADGIQDTVAFGATFNYDDVSWVLQIRNASSTVVRSYSGFGSALSVSWNGHDTAGLAVPDGLYTFDVAATDGSASATAQATTTVDLTSPNAALTSPASEVLSNVYQEGATDIQVVGTATDLNLLNWALDYGLGAAPSSWTSIASGTAPVLNGNLGLWKTLPIANGDFTVRLRATDRAGNTSLVTLARSIRNFSMSQNVLQANFAAGQSADYVSVVPFDLSETIVLKSQSGSVVRTLVDQVSRVAGTYTDTWNGIADIGGLVVDGPYFYVATVSAGAHTMSWDLTSQFLPPWGQYFDNLGIQAFDPFNNQPATFTYNAARTAVANVAFGQNGNTFGIAPNCNPPQFCLADGEYQEAGPHTYKWSGVDVTGALRPDIRGVGVVISQTNFSKNALVAFGTKPVVTNVRALPPVYGPAVGTQNVEFDLTTYQSQPAEVSVAFFNQASLSTLRTVTGTISGSGHVTIPWDGRADNDMWVAPGRYTITVTVTDARGVQVRGQILTTIQY